jgi:hypothetical protein
MKYIILLALIVTLTISYASTQIIQKDTLKHETVKDSGVTTQTVVTPTDTVMQVAPEVPTSNPLTTNPIEKAVAGITIALLVLLKWLPNLKSVYVGLSNSSNPLILRWISETSPFMKRVSWLSLSLTIPLGVLIPFLPGGLWRDLLVALAAFLGGIYTLTLLTTDKKELQN